MISRSKLRKIRVSHLNIYLRFVHNFRLIFYIKFKAVLMKIPFSHCKGAQLDSFIELEDFKNKLNFKKIRFNKEGFLDNALPNGNPSMEAHFNWTLKEENVKTRLTYNCAHHRSTKETLTIEYFRIILEKKIRVKIFGRKFVLGKIFG